MNRVVLDTSIVLKWFLKDEQGSEETFGFLQSFVAGEIKLIAPSLMEYELVNGLVIAQRRGRIKEETLIGAIDAFHELGIEFKSVADIIGKVLSYTKKYNRSVYDAAYLAVAEDEGARFITSDKVLYNAVKNKLSWVHLSS